MKPQGASRRDFLCDVGVALGAVVTMGAAPATTQSAAQPSKAVPATSAKDVDYLLQTGWNVWSTRFVDAPTWEWQPFKGAAGYVVRFAQWNDATAKTVRLTEPRFDMKDHWAELHDGSVDLLAWAVDEKDQAICTAWRKRIFKSPGWDGVTQKLNDLDSSIDRVMKYLLAPARDEVRDFEKGLPRSCWSCCEDNITGQRRMLQFPALHHPSFIFAFLEYAKQFPQSKLTDEALRQGKQYGDWLLANRLPVDWKCSLFPYSTIENGRPEGLVEGRNITLFRSARVGEAMVALYEQFRDERYLNYAKYLADKYVELQRPDGSWPYRVDPMDGRVVEEYTSNAVTPARLFGILESVEANPRYAQARQKAADWVMQNPVRTRRWQGMYEDVGSSAPYRNLQHWDANEMIRYLVHFHRDEPQMMQIAEDMNHYIEDQFVIWQQGDACIGDHCPTPTVLEQYTCYLPMESHTSMWIRSLIALHRATGNDSYLSKSIAAANSIMAAQQPSGAYSTWGFDTRFDRPALTVDWPGCNCVAIQGLLQLKKYIDGLPGARQQAEPI